MQTIINVTNFSSKLQNIVYNEYLPIVVGPKMMQKYRLNIGNGLTKYNPKTDPRVSNEFSTVNKTFHQLILLLRLLSVLVTRKYSTSSDHISTERKLSIRKQVMETTLTCTDAGSFHLVTFKLTNLTLAKEENPGSTRLRD